MKYITKHLQPEQYISPSNRKGNNMHGQNEKKASSFGNLFVQAIRD